MGTSIKKTGILLADGSRVGKNLCRSDISEWYAWNSNAVISYTDNGVKATIGSANNSGIIIPFGEDNALIGGEECTISFKYRTDATSLGTPYLLCRSGGNVPYTTVSITKSEEEWKDFSVTITFPSTGERITYALLIPYVKNVWIEIKDHTFKLEKGSIITPWTVNEFDDIYTGTHAFFEGYNPASIGDGYVSANEFYEY